MKGREDGREGWGIVDRGREGTGETGMKRRTGGRSVKEVEAGEGRMEKGDTCKAKMEEQAVDGQLRTGGGRGGMEGK